VVELEFVITLLISFTSAYFSTQPTPSIQ